MRKRMRSAILGCCVGLVAMQPAFAVAGAGEDARMLELERQMKILVGELQSRQGSIDALSRQVAILENKLAGTATAGAGPETGQNKEELKSMVAEAVAEQQKESPLSRFSLGGYGEIHANFAEGGKNGASNDKLDIHRMVALVGYEFNDWIKFQSEIELEHAFVEDTQSGDKAGGYLMLEQAYVDFLLSDQANVRFGRVLTPVGITNQNHEPTTFYSVERPTFDNVIIPSTWSSDGIGLFGNLASNLSYEAYVVGGLNGSKFTSSGIRNGRIKDEPSLNDMAFTGRLDYYPFLEGEVGWTQSLRLGASMYHGGINNGQKGNDPKVSGDIGIYSADASVRIGDFDVKSAVAFTEINGSGLDPKVAEEIFGYSVEAGYHIMPIAWKTGKLANSDLVAFVRYDQYDTQHQMSAGVAPDLSKDIYEWTYGLAFYPVPSLVVKADYQVIEAEQGDPDNKINLGIGWIF